MTEVGEMVGVVDPVTGVHEFEAKMRERRAILAVTSTLAQSGSEDIALDLSHVLTNDDLPTGAPVVQLALGVQDSGPETRSEMRSRREAQAATKRFRWGRTS